MQPDWTTRGICLIYNGGFNGFEKRNSFARQNLWVLQPAVCESRGPDRSPLWLVIAKGCIWLLSSVFLLLSSSLSTSFSVPPFANSHIIFLLQDSLHLSSPPHLFLSPTCAVLFSLHPPFPFCSVCSQPLSPPLSLHFNPVWLGRTTSGSPHPLLLVWDLSASESEIEATHSLCCGFGKRIFVKFLPVLAPCAGPPDWSANSPFCWHVTVCFSVHFLQWINY